MKRFFYKICQAPHLYLTLRVLPIEFNSFKFSFVRYVFVETFGVFLGMTKMTPYRHKTTPKMTKNP